MSSISTIVGFPDENQWPFLGHIAQLNQSLTFLMPEEPNAPSRLLRISGESGVGKSFFIKELICRFAKQAPSSICLYIDVEESEFESVELERRLAVLASYPMEPSRRDPQHVPTNVDLAKYLRPLPSWLQVLRYTYMAIKELVIQIPVAGKITNAFLPKELPVSRRRELAVSGRFWDYLSTITRQQATLLAIDNIQFLPESLLLELESVLAVVDSGFRLVVIERLLEGVSSRRVERCFSSHRLSLEIKSLSQDETHELVRTVLGEDTPKLSEISGAIFRKSHGIPKQIWLQLRTLKLNQATKSDEVIVGGYEETILGLPSLDRLIVQAVTLLMGGLKVEDLISLLNWIVHPLSEDDIRKAILDLTLIGLLIINGAYNNRIRTEHELVRRSVRRTITEQEAISLRQDVISAINNRLEQALDDDEYERLVDRLVGLLSPEDLRVRSDLLAHLISLIDRQRFKERFHYLVSLYSTSGCREAIDMLPPHCLVAFLDAFQKTSQFDKGLAAVELMRMQGKLSQRKLNLFAAKYLVQKFEYEEAESLLRQIGPGSDRDVILFNILLNLCREDEARQMIAALPPDALKLNEFQCVMLRNSSHLYDEATARQMLLRAKKGFQHNNLKFGEASTLNNLGVLEIWARKYNDAYQYLMASRIAFSALDSNELYQPLTNLAVLHAVRGDLNSGKRFLKESKATVSPWLRMDHILIGFNQLGIDIIDDNLSKDVAVTKASELYYRSLETKDLRFQTVLSWFANQLEVIFLGSSSIPKPPDFEEHIRSGNHSGLEVFYDFTLDGQTITLVFILSPHWRY